MAYPVPFVNFRGIAAVFAVRNAMLFHPGLDIGPGDTQKRPQNQTSARHATASHAAQTAGSRAAQKVQQKGFSIVVGVVGHGNGVEPFRQKQLREPRIAQVAGRHLY